MARAMLIFKRGIRASDTIKVIIVSAISMEAHSATALAGLPPKAKSVAITGIRAVINSQAVVIKVMALSIMLSIKVTQTMLKILNDLGLREPVMSDVSEDDYL